MANCEDQDMYLFQSGFEQTPTYAGQAFDDFLSTSPTSGEPELRARFLNPNDLAIKHEGIQETQLLHRSEARSSPSSSGSSRSSSSIDAIQPCSETLMAARVDYPSTKGVWSSGINGLTVPSNEDLFPETSMEGVEDDYAASNEQMATDFDFETAASTPSGLNQAALPPQKKPIIHPFRSSTQLTNSFAHVKGGSPKLPAPQPQFYFGGSREASPLSAVLPNSQAPSPWAKHSPSSGLEETFNGISMSGDSPGNATFSPNLHFSSNGFSFDPDSSATPSTFTKAVSSTPSTVNSMDGRPQLKVFPTSLKSRVETQIPIKMILSPLPPSAKKLRLPTHTVSKPKFLAKSVVERSPEILELQTSLVCTSAMQDPLKLERAYMRARGEVFPPLSRASPESSDSSPSSRDYEDRPLEGGEVRICSGCIQRERKRASRKKQKKPDEEELFQKDEEKRVVVFNTNEIKDWVEPTKDSQLGLAGLTDDTSASFPPGSMQVELPMRIACYCRHQNEKMGFQVIFTIKDYRDNVVAQQITNPIMITDDHKTQNTLPQLPTPSPALPQAPQLPGAGVFSTSGAEAASIPPSHKSFKQSFSTTDLHGLQHNFNPSFPMAPASNPFAVPSTLSTGTSATLTPRNLSRPASPSGPSGQPSKRRKQSGSGKVPSALTMTRMETGQAPLGPSTFPNTATSSPYAINMGSFMNVAERGFAMPNARQQQYGTSPPTPNSHENGFVSFNRSFSLENLPRQAIVSAPSSRQPSRPGSPGSARNSFGAADANFGQAVTNQLLGQPTRRPSPLIHKLVPAEGSVTGGTEVTLLGNGFYQGLEVMFGDTEATTTTFWGEKCLNCITPPALQPGVVSVMFKHEHPSFGAMQQQTQARHPMFTYIDDRELEMYRLALKTVGQQMQHSADNPYAVAQQLLNGNSMQSMWLPHGSYGGMGGLQRRGGPSTTGPVDLLELESHMLGFLDYMATLPNSSMQLPLDGRRPTGLALLHLASSLGLTRLVAGLTARRASVDILDNNGNTPIHHAAMNGHTHIIHRLRLAGADHRVVNKRNFTAADLATSLLAYQAAVAANHHYRSRSAGGTPMQLDSRNNSTSSLRSFWAQLSSSSSVSYDSESSEDDLDNLADIPHARGNSQRLEQTVVAQRHTALGSRRGSNQIQTQHPLGVVSNPQDGRPVSPAAFMWAWRDSLAAQIHQFQESTQRMMPNLPNLSTLPALPDYQTYPVMRRVSSLFPPRPASRQGDRPPKEGWWEGLMGSQSSSSTSAPPAYTELYPTPTGSAEDIESKKVSVMAAAADAAGDIYFRSRESKKAGSLVTDNAATRHRTAPSVERVALSRDRKLFLFWIPVLAIVLALMLKSLLPDVVWLTTSISRKGGVSELVANQE